MNILTALGKCDLAVCMAIFSLALAFILAIVDLFRNPAKKKAK